MQTASNLVTGPFVQPGSLNILSEMLRHAAGFWAGLRAVHDITHWNRYRMQQEDRLRGPLSNEVRRLSWY